MTPTPRIPGIAPDRLSAEKRAATLPDPAPAIPRGARPVACPTAIDVPVLVRRRVRAGGDDFAVTAVAEGRLTG
ncbi:MAG: hypothetical protein DI556_16440 [Rhodovulum sulfidophilum]|uniref:Uncharacterized protein n=1 Tax=Rhodovulum sulfidophilum TaxID=35806 RepID=A0A2W5Q8T9_RHOSU|nr:MAG: hypothetical protein DI556_16440 [Rhodovulum sulfidophilum]